MGQNKSPETYKELLRLLLEVLTEYVDESPEEVDEYLRDAGYDPDALVMRMQQRMKVAMDTSPLNWRNQTEQIQQERNRLKELVDLSSGTMEQIKAAIRTLLNSSEARLALHHRNLNLDEMSEADLSQLLGELRFQLSQHRDTTEDEDL